MFFGEFVNELVRNSNGEYVCSLFESLLIVYQFLDPGIVHHVRFISDCTNTTFMSCSSLNVDTRLDNCLDLGASSQRSLI